MDELLMLSAKNELSEYSGKNPYLLSLQGRLGESNFNLSKNQIDYIVKHNEAALISINRVVSISKEYAEVLKEKDGLTFTPVKILVEYVLKENDDNFFVWGKLKRNQQLSSGYLIPKTHLIGDMYFEESSTEIDFKKFEDLTDDIEFYDHQKPAIKFLYDRKGAILADDMGLGKSMSSIVAALAKDFNKILIVCPASLKLNWEREINYFCDDTTIINRKKWIEGGKFTIINYDILRNFHTPKPSNKVKTKPKVFHRELMDSDFDLIIIDEAHKLKNNQSQRGRIMTELAQSTKYVWLLTGTPITSRPIDYYNLLYLIQSDAAKNWVRYVENYCSGKKIVKYTQWGPKEIWVNDGASNLNELHLQTKNDILRRLKEDVLDMPEKSIVKIPYELTAKERKEYNNIWDLYLEEQERKGKNINIQRDIVELGLMRKFIAMSTIERSIELAENAIEQGQKVIIFTTFTDELNTIYDYFKGMVVKHNGKMSTPEKQQSVDDFQTKDEIKVFVGNVISAGVGITLTEANIVIFNSFAWVPGENEQCEDRAYRIGQKNNVTVYYQLFKKTITTLMWGVLDQKKRIINTILNGDERSTIKIDSSYDRFLTKFEIDEILSEIDEDKDAYLDQEPEYVEFYETA